jgi:aspartyl protease family protein
MRLWLSVLILAGAGTVALALADHPVVALLDVRDVMLGAGVLLGLTGLVLALTAPAPVPAQRIGPLRTIVALAALSGLALAGYNFRFEILTALHAAAGEPGSGQARFEDDGTGDRTVRIRRRPDGHFLAQSEVNGLPMSLLVDTGASTVVLKPSDARALGIDLERLRYNVPVQTANGTTFAASIRLQSLAVGNIRVTDLDALIARPGTLKDSLLGMTFLNRLRSYEFAGDLLTLRI